MRKEILINEKYNLLNYIFSYKSVIAMLLNYI